MKTATDVAHDDKVHVLHPAAHRQAETHSTLTTAECSAAFLIFVTWIVLFGVGILVDTEPYRDVISSTAVAKLKTTPAAVAAPATEAAAPSSAAARTAPGRTKAWLVVIFSFLPLNLVWLCATSSALGAFGNRANLTNDRAGRKLRDNNNPYVAAVLRGFFAYLFLISGLLLLDDSPFANPAPAQYVRLAGFLSLLSFVISYQPRFFNTLIVWAFQRIEAREGADQDKEKDKTSTDTVHAIRTVEVTATHSSHGGAETPTDH